MQMSVISGMATKRRSNNAPAQCILFLALVVALLGRSNAIR
jgi:hypothetical protein